MGEWGREIGQSDVYADVYGLFFQLYNEGSSAEEASESVLNDLAAYFSDSDDTFDAHFALARAQWETQSLSEDLLRKVRQLIVSGAATANWTSRGASETDARARSLKLVAYLDEISSPRPARKRRRRQQQFNFLAKLLLELRSPDDRKTFSVKEHFVDGRYVHTGSMIMWGEVGGSVFYFAKEGAGVSAKWLDAHNLEVTLPTGLQLTKQDYTLQCRQDVVKICYRYA